MNADLSGGGHAVAGAVLGGTAGDGWGRAAAYDAYADGLHTYALWYLRDHDSAADAVYCGFVAADRNHTNLQQPEQIQPWLYALLRRECRLRSAEADAPTPVSLRLRPKSDALDESGVAASLVQLEGNLRRAEFQSLAWPEAEGLAPAHREVLELSIRHGLDSRGLALVLGLREGSAGLAPSRGFGLLADAWRELERSLAAAAVAASGRENCAQLAELTFGWSGKLNATLRAPLTEHVDRCSRCQHYLHTVIGTPSAPTILPFVAAPRALRDILLGELGTAYVAEDAGIDLLALGARCGTFGPEGFPSRVDPSQGTTNAPAGAGRGPRRRQPGAGRAGRPQRTTPSAAARPQPVHYGSGSPADAADATNGGSSTFGFTATAAGTAIVSGPDNGSGQGSGTSTVGFTATAAGSAIVSGSDSRAGSGGSRTVGFTATAVGTASLPSTSDMRRRPPTAQPTNIVGASGPGPRPRAPEADDLYRAKGSWADKVLPQEPADDGAAALWRPAPEPTFVQTASGRFATRPPAAGARPRPPLGGTSVMPAAATATSASVAAPGASRLPRFAKPGNASKPVTSTKPGKTAKSGSTAPPGVRPRHKARPMRQAVVSAMALGAIGAVAAAAAAMLGVTSNPHSNSAALDGSQSSEPLAATSSNSPSSDGSGAGQLAVSVTTGSSGASTGGLLTGASGLGAGLPSSGTGIPGSQTPTAASSGAFYVSVNQRAADPNSVQILLRNTGTAPLAWSAAPSVAWLTLSQSSGTLAAGQSLTVTATATGKAPSGEWTAQIVFSPGGIVVTLHGGIPTSTTPTTPAPGGGGTSGTPSSPTTSASPTSPPSTHSPTPPPTTSAPPPTSSQPTASASGSTSGSQSPTSTDTASSSPSTPPPSHSGHGH